MSSALSMKNCAEYSSASMPHSSLETLATSKCFIVFPNKARWNAHSPSEILNSGFASADHVRLVAVLHMELAATAMVVVLRNSRRVEAERAMALLLKYQKLRWRRVGDSLPDAKRTSHLEKYPVLVQDQQHEPFDENDRHGKE